MRVLHEVLQVSGETVRSNVAHGQHLAKKCEEEEEEEVEEEEEEAARY